MDHPFDFSFGKQPKNSQFQAVDIQISDIDSQNLSFSSNVSSSNQTPSFFHDDSKGFESIEVPEEKSGQFSRKSSEEPFAPFYQAPRILTEKNIPHLSSYVSKLKEKDSWLNFQDQKFKMKQFNKNFNQQKQTQNPFYLIQKPLNCEDQFLSKNQVSQQQNSWSLINKPFSFEQEDSANRESIPDWHIQKMRMFRQNCSFQIPSKTFEETLRDFSQIFDEISIEDPPKQMIFRGKNTVSAWKDFTNLIAQVLKLKSVHDFMQSIRDTFSFKKIPRTNQVQNGNFMAFRNNSEVCTGVSNIVKNFLNVFADISQLQTVSLENFEMIDDVFQNIEILIKVVKELGIRVSKKFLKKKYGKLRPAQQIQIQTSIHQSLNFMERYFAIPLFKMTESGDFDKITESSNVFDVIQIAIKYFPFELGNVMSLVGPFLGNKKLLQAIGLEDIVQLLNLGQVCH